MSKVMTAIRILIVFCAISSVLAFTIYKWTTLLQRYGNYGSYVAEVGGIEVDGADELSLGKKFWLEYTYQDQPPFEKETIYREAIKYQYWVAFLKIWTFGGFVFASSFLLLKLTEPEIEETKKFYQKGGQNIGSDNQPVKNKELAKPKNKTGISVLTIIGGILLISTILSGNLIYLTDWSSSQLVGYNIWILLAVFGGGYMMYLGTKK